MKTEGNPKSIIDHGHVQSSRAALSCHALPMTCQSVFVRRATSLCPLAIVRRGIGWREAFCFLLLLSLQQTCSRGRSNRMTTRSLWRFP